MTPEERQNIRDMIETAEKYMRDIDGDAGLKPIAVMAATNQWFAAAVLAEACDIISRSKGDGPVTMTIMANPAGLLEECAHTWFLIQRSLKEGRTMKQVAWGQHKMYAVSRRVWDDGFGRSRVFMADFQMGPFRMIYRTNDGADAMLRYVCYVKLAEALGLDRRIWEGQ